MDQATHRPNHRVSFDAVGYYLYDWSNVMSEETYWEDYDTGRVATVCDVSEKPTHSQLLDANGNRMKYEATPVGFDLNTLRHKGCSNE